MERGTSAAFMSTMDRMVMRKLYDKKVGGSYNFISRAAFVPSRRSGAERIVSPTVPGGLPGQASSVTQKKTIPTASRPRTPPTKIASLIFPAIALPQP